MTSPFNGTKVLRHLDRLQVLLAGRTPPPITVEFDLTAECNHHCPACGGGRYEGTMGTDAAKRLLVELAEYGARGLMFTGGGEPLKHPDFGSICQVAATAGLAVGLITNGTLITPELADRIVRCCQWVRVSIDAADPELYKRVHGVDGVEYSRAWAAVGLLVAARQRHRVSTTIGVSYMVSDSSRRGMLRMTKTARYSGADYLQFRPFWGQAVPIEAELPICRQQETETFCVFSSCQKYDRLGSARGYSTCHGSALAAVIQADGQVPLCCNMRGRPEWYLGNVFEAGFQKVWESPERGRLLAHLDVSRCVPLCRLDAINPILEDMATPKEHEAFL